MGGRCFKRYCFTSFGYGQSKPIATGISLKAKVSFSCQKVRLQTSTTYKSGIDCALTTLKWEGLRGFFKGMAFPLVSASAYNSFVFGSYHHYQALIGRWRYNDSNQPLGYKDQCLAAMATGGTSVIIGAPVDLVKIRLQVQTETKKSRLTLNTAPAYLQGLSSETSRTSASGCTSLRKAETPRVIPLAKQQTIYRGPIDCFIDVYRRNGIRGIYRGAPTMIIRDVPGYTVFLVPYDSLREYFIGDHDSKLAALVASAWAGGLTGAISWGVMHPVDTVKSRLQADIGRKTQKYRGFWHCTVSIYREHGMSAFFRGLTLNALRGFPQCGALLCGVEFTTQLFRGSKGE
ncbi:solute carrier family 25 member 48-like isoform X2 [Clavelina lepadiformis]